MEKTALLKKHIHLLAQVQNGIVTESKPFQGSNVILWIMDKYGPFQGHIKFCSKVGNPEGRSLNDHALQTSKFIYKYSWHWTLFRETNFKDLN
jgi:hypothetical protein